MNYRYNQNCCRFVEGMRRQLVLAHATSSLVVSSSNSNLLRPIVSCERGTVGRGLKEPRRHSYRSFHSKRQLATTVTVTIVHQLRCYYCVIAYWRRRLSLLLLQTTVRARIYVRHADDKLSPVIRKESMPHLAQSINTGRTHFGSDLCRSWFWTTQNTYPVFLLVSYTCSRFTTISSTAI